MSKFTKSIKYKVKHAISTQIKPTSFVRIRSNMNQQCFIIERSHMQRLRFEPKNVFYYYIFVCF